MDRGHSMLEAQPQPATRSIKCWRAKTPSSFEQTGLPSVRGFANLVRGMLRTDRKRSYRLRLPK
jgi:hypothetical protein